MKALFHPDRPIETREKDTLNFDPVVEQILNSMKSCMPPFTWGIYGDWGSGKTSLMRLLKEQMEADLADAPNRNNGTFFIPVWFDAWRYENEENIIYPLVHEIVKDMKARCSETARTESLLEASKRVGSAVLCGLTDAVLRTVTQKTFGDAISLEDVQKTFELVEKRLTPFFDKWSDEVGEVSTAFLDFVDKYILAYRTSRQMTQDEELFLAVFIDDLDRCLPDVAIQVLERLKNHLENKMCIFILGINPSVVYKSIRKKYQDLDIDGRQHLEKIIQFSIGVPQPTGDSVQRFVASGLETRYYGKESLSPYIKAFADALIDSGFTNPRKITRIMNRYLDFVLKHLMKDIADFDMQAVTKLIVLKEYYRPFYQLLAESGFQIWSYLQNTGTLLEETFLKQYGEKWKHLVSELESMKPLLKMNPGIGAPFLTYRLAIDELFGLQD
jgi:hypothetical protein